MITVKIQAGQIILEATDGIENYALSKFMEENHDKKLKDCVWASLLAERPFNDNEGMCKAN